MTATPEIRIIGRRVAGRVGRKQVVETPLEEFLLAIERSVGERREKLEIRPKGVRLWTESRDTVGLALELAPHARTVRWLADDSKAPFGMNARYESYYVSFPWIVMLLVFQHGELTGEQQLYYRRESLDTGDELLIPNLYNVARGYGQQCWLCLQKVGELASLPWPAKINKIINHTFSAGFNKSAERHEGNSYWSPTNAVDPRVATMALWQEAARANRRFVLDLPWRPAGTTARMELERMLDRAAPPRRLESSTELFPLLYSAAAQPVLPLQGEF